MKIKLLLITLSIALSNNFVFAKDDRPPSWEISKEEYLKRVNYQPVGDRQVLDYYASHLVKNLYGVDVVGYLKVLFGPLDMGMNDAYNDLDADFLIIQGSADGTISENCAGGCGIYFLSTAEPVIDGFDCHVFPEGKPMAADGRYIQSKGVHSFDQTEQIPTFKIDGEEGEFIGYLMDYSGGSSCDWSHDVTFIRINDGKVLRKNFSLENNRSSFGFARYFWEKN